MNNNTYVKDAIIITARNGSAVFVQKPDVIRALEAAGYVVTRKPPGWGTIWVHKATGSSVVVVSVSGTGIRYATTGGTVATVPELDQWYEQYRKG